MNLKSWNIAKLNKEQSAIIAEEYQIPHVLAMLLEQRTKGNRNEIENILYDIGLTESPFELIDMDKAVDRLKKALDNFEKIAIYGDYDADGVTATSILYDYLQAVDADVMYYIPQREGEGYGMNKKAIEYLSNCEVKLIVTVDNGIASVDEVDFANSLGLDVIITDHHRPAATLPNAVAVVDAHRSDCPSYFKDYCGAGIALKLVLAMELDFGDEDEILDRFSDLACMGTIADIVNVNGENRAIIKKGLENLRDSQRLGVQAIYEKANISNIDATSVAFGLVPRINATGRMGSPDRAVRLLTTQDEEEALLYAEEVCKENDNRKSVELEILNSAIKIIENDDKIKYQRVLVVSGENWHAGVIGIVASRLVEKYSKPCIVISVIDGIGVGSGRSFEGFSLFDALTHSANSLLRFGGHTMAAGLKVEQAKIDIFRNDINDYAKNNCDIMPTPKINIDLKLQPKALSVEIPQQIAVLEPFGMGNLAPVFGLFSMKLQSIVPVGAEKNHLRLTFVRDDAMITCMLFSCTAQSFPYTVGSVLDLAVSLSINEYKGMTNLSTIIKAIKPSTVDIEQQIIAYNIYEKIKRNEALSQEEKQLVSPTREDLAALYRFIKTSSTQYFSYLQILNDLKISKLNLAKIMLSLDALEECNLIKLQQGEVINIKIIPTNAKVDIMNTNVLQNLK